MTKFNPLEEFANIAGNYLSTIEPLESVEQVNNWCSNKTHGKIDKILDALSINDNIKCCIFQRRMVFKI